MRRHVDRHWIDHVTPVAIILFAAWTVCVHLVSLFGGSFNVVMWVAPVALLAGVGLAWWWVRGLPVEAFGMAMAPACDTAERVSQRRLWWALAAAVAWVAVYALTHNYVVFWWVDIVGLAWAWVTLWRGGHASAIAPNTPRQREALLLVALCLVAAVVSLVANRPDIDDSLYLSIPATLLHSPHDPILLHDTLYRLPQLPIQATVYREHTYEVLIGLVSRLLGVAPVTTAYLVFPPVFSVLMVFAWARLLRLLSPQRWLGALALLVLAFLVLGEVHHAYGNFAFVRIFQGKAILMCWGIPALLYFALRFAQSGRAADWWLLCTAQIACIGLSSTGIFVAPVAAAIALGSTWQPSWVHTRRVLVGVAASWYVVVVGVLLAVVSVRYIDSISDIAVPGLESVVDDTFGHWSALPLLVALLAGWAACGSRFAARVLAGTSLLFLLVCFNPYAYPLWMRHVMGPSAFWRLTWALPLPLMLAVLLRRLLADAVCDRSGWWKAAVFACATVVVGWAAYNVGTLRAANQVTLGAPRIKAPRADYALAQTLVQTLPESSSLLAPVSIASWCSTFVRHPQLVSVRPMYLPSVAPQLGEAEAATRYDLQLYVSGWRRIPDAPDELRRAVAGHALGAVVVAGSVSWLPEIDEVMRTAGYRKVVDGDYVVWWGPEFVPARK